MKSRFVILAHTPPDRDEVPLMLGIPLAERRLPSLLHLLLLAALALQAGCSSASARRDRELLARHPVRERRMSVRVEAGYTPSGVWKVQGLHNTVYLAGTSHLVTSDQVPFPSPFYAAYADAQEIYLEAGDLSVFGQLRLMLRLRKWIKSRVPEFFYTDGRTLTNDLTTSTIAELKRFYGRRYSQRERMTPVLLAFLAQAESLAEQDAKDGGVEAVFAALARRDGKRLRTLDDSSVDGVVVLVLDNMLLEVRGEIRRRGADAVIHEKVLGAQKPVEETTWRNGDLAALERENEETRHDSPALYEKLGPERNRKWLPKLTSALRARQNVMVLVGVAHLAGKDGLLNLLREEGFTVEQLFGVDSTVSEIRNDQR